MIVTFYSYKGGVGRTFCLANVGVVLARWGYRVLCVDWDLEAPGLHHYFPGENPGPGVVELIHAFARDERPDWAGAATPVERMPGGGSLSLIPAGRLDDDYPERVQGLDWAALYHERDLGRHLEDIRGQWAEQYDFVLLDSRTGVTDVGGICTAQLPDLLALCFVANHQSLHGAADVARRAAVARNALPYERFRVLTLPLLARLDSREEYKLAAQWQNTASEVMREFYDQWVPETTQALDLIEKTTVPHVPVWSFGEEIPARQERGSNPQLVTYTFETIAALIARSLTGADDLVRSRDDYVRAARKGNSPAIDKDREARPAPADPSWSDDPRIVLWGPPRSGKTTLLAALNTALRTPAESRMTTGFLDQATADFVLSSEQSLFAEGRFPAADSGASRVKLVVHRSVPHPTWLDRLLGRRPRREAVVRLLIDVLDPPGDEFIAGQPYINVLNAMAAADGFLVTVDPVGFARVDPFLAYHGLLQRLASLMGEQGRLTGGRLPQHVAVCVTKFDLPAVAGDAIRQRPAGHHETEPDERAEEFLKSLLLSGPEHMRDLPEALRSYFRPERIRYFVTSAIGFQATGDRGHITGRVKPVNVAEPFLWLAEQSRP